MEELKIALHKEEAKRKARDARERTLNKSNEALIAHNAGLHAELKKLQAGGAHQEAMTRHLAMQVGTILNCSLIPLLYLYHYSPVLLHDSVNSTRCSAVTHGVSF